MNPKTIGTCPGCWRKVNVQRGVIPRHSGAPGVRSARPCPASGQTWTPAIGAAAEEAERQETAAIPGTCDDLKKKDVGPLTSHNSQVITRT